MSIFRAMLFLVLTVNGLWLTTQSASAAVNPSTSSETGIACQDGVCTVQVNLYLLEPKFEVQAPLIDELGIRNGDEIAYLALPIDKEQKYFLLLVSDRNALGQIVEGTSEVASPSAPFHYSVALVANPQDLFMYLEGNVSLHYDERASLMNQLVNPASSLLVMPDYLPVQEQIHASIEGLLSDDVSEMFVEIRGSYTLSGGILIDRIGFDAVPISTDGLLAVRAEGVELAAKVQSAIQPDQLFTGELAVEMFAPFTADGQDMEITLSGDTHLPFASLKFSGVTTVDESKITAGYHDAVERIGQRYDWFVEQTQISYTALATSASSLSRR